MKRPMGIASTVAATSMKIGKDQVIHIEGTSWVDGAAGAMPTAKRDLELEPLGAQQRDTEVYEEKHGDDQGHPDHLHSF